MHPEKDVAPGALHIPYIRMQAGYAALPVASYRFRPLSFTDGNEDVHFSAGASFLLHLHTVLVDRARPVDVSDLCTCCSKLILPRDSVAEHKFGRFN